MAQALKFRYFQKLKKDAKQYKNGKRERSTLWLLLKRYDKKK